MTVRLYFVHPLQQNGYRIASVLADDGLYDDASATLLRVRQFVTDEGREIDSDGTLNMMALNSNIAAVLIDKTAKEE